MSIISTDEIRKHIEAHEDLTPGFDFSQRQWDELDWVELTMSLEIKYMRGIDEETAAAWTLTHPDCSKIADYLRLAEPLSIEEVEELKLILKEALSSATEELELKHASETIPNIKEKKLH